LSFQIQVDGITYYFQGPVTPENLPEKSGVYMVMGDGGHPVYIGESANIRQRVTGGHEKEGCWKRHGSGQSIRYVLIPNAHVRVEVQDRAIEKWHPVCN
jgi:hypothetical protein